MFARINQILALLLGAFLITFNFPGCDPEIPGDDDDDVSSDDDVTGDDDTTDDDDTTQDDDDVTDDDDDNDTLPAYAIDFTSDCDELEGLPGDPTVYIDNEEIGASPLSTDVIEGEHAFKTEGPNILAVSYNDYEITDDMGFHFRCGLAPEGYFDLYDAPCGMGGSFITTLEIETVVSNDAVKLSVDGAPSYFIRGSGYFIDDPQDVLGTISVELTEINDIQGGTCAYLQE